MNMDRPACAPGALPLLGHALPLLRSPLSFLSSLPGSGDLVEVRLGPWRAYVVCSPALTHQVLLDDRTFDKGGPLIDKAREALGVGVGTCPHAQHRRQRRLNQPAFQSTRMPGYVAEMTKQINAVTECWREGQTINVLAALEEMTIRILIATMFAGARLSDTDLTKILHDVLDISRGVFRRMLMPQLLAQLPLLGNRRFEEAHTHLRQVARSTIEHYRSNGTDRGDLVSVLVAAQDPDAHGDSMQGKLSDDELTDTVITYFFAGAETSASLVAWALHLTASHPDVERQLHAEVDTVLGDAPATFDDLPRLEVANRIITETLRFRPPAWIFTRTTTQETELGGHRVPAGSTVIYSQYLVQHLPDVYHDPEHFNPDRWRHNHTTSMPHGALVPFAAGARKCIGDTFATTEATLAIATIATRWKMEPVPGTHVRPGRGLVLRPEGLLMSPVPRTSHGSG
ncbi:cytochrome P450 [Streptomyces sp. NPDC020681]|uniref:cytochrome P450 n=1 Tax=Streptomyces sp. NPDC020681 TaxID=3365083 RepID=UPI003793F125